MQKKFDFFILLLIIFVFWTFFLPGFRVAGDFHFTSYESAIDFLNLPQAWSYYTSVDLGEYVTNLLWAWPVDFIYGLLTLLGLSFSLLTRLFWLAPVPIIGYWGMNRLLSHYLISSWGRFVGTLFFLFNTYILLLVDGGQFRVALSYAWMPVAYFAVIKATDGNNIQKIQAGLIISVLSFLDVRFVYVLLLLLTLKFIYSVLLFSGGRYWEKVYSWIKAGIVSGFVFLGLTAFWWIPIVILKPPIIPSGNVASANDIFLSFTTWKHALFLQHPNWYENIFGRVSSLRIEFLLIPILVFLALILKKKSSLSLRLWKGNKVVGFWLLVALVSVFLVKGANWPLPGVYPWLFNNIPGFSMFRDSTKFFFLVALSYSVLIGQTVDELTNRFKWKLNIGDWSLKVVPIVLVAYFLFLVRPVWLGKMTGTFSKPVYQDEYLKVADILQKDKKFARVFWIPAKAPLSYSSPNHPSAEMLRLNKKRSFSIGTVGTYETSNFVREAPFMGELFDISAINYIVYPYPDTRREDLKQDNINYYYNFSEQISGLSWIEKKINQPPVQVFKTKKSQDHFFFAENIWFVVGSDRLYWDLVDTDGFELSSNALIFAEEQPGLLGKIKDVSNAKVLLFDKNETDLAAGLIGPNKFVFPAQYLDYSPSIGSGSSGWWKRETTDLIWWRDFLQTKYGIDDMGFDYGGGYAIAEGSKRLEVKSKKLKEGDQLLARVMSSSRGGNIEFYQGDEPIGSIDTKIESPEKVEVKLTGYEETPDQIFEYDKADLFWYEVGKLTINHEPLIIRTEGEINVVNALAVVDQTEWGSMEDRVEGLIDENKVIAWGDLADEEKSEMFASNSNASVSYQRLSPTHYKVKVEGLENPATLAFSETYNQLWQLSGKDSYPLYSLINGFTIEANGEYNVVFSAQKYVLPGLYISAAAFIGVLALLFFLNNRKVRKI